jgi:hypothetical protein
MRTEVQPVGALRMIDGRGACVAGVTQRPARRIEIERLLEAFVGAGTVADLPAMEPRASS